MNAADILASARERADAADFPFVSVGQLPLRTHGLPDWWTEQGNLLFCTPDLDLPALHQYPGLPPITNARLCLAGAVGPDQLTMWGDGPTVLIGAGTRLPAGRIACGGGSTIVLGDNIGSTWAAQVDCRNGGLVLVGENGLWAGNIQIHSDDMHAISDSDGTRLNAFGGTVIVGPRVWLASEALLLNGTVIGSDTVVGARSIVKGPVPANSVCAGIPARVIRTETHWEFDDRP